MAQEACPGIRILFVSKDKVGSVRDELGGFWAKNIPKTIPETRKFHFFKATSPTQLEVSDVSLFQLNSDTSQAPVNSVPIFKGGKKPAT